MAAIVRQAVILSLIFWGVALAITAVTTALGDESFGEYLMFVALIMLGLMLLASAPLANWATAMEARVWGGTTDYQGENRSEQVRGITAIGLMLVLAPQVALVSLLFS